MTNKFSKQYNYAEMSVLNGENKDNFPLQVSPKGGGHDTFCELEGRSDTVWELDGST